MTQYTLQSRHSRKTPLSAVYTAREPFTRAGRAGSAPAKRSSLVSRGYSLRQRSLPASWLSLERLSLGLTNGLTSLAIHSRKNSKRRLTRRTLERFSSSRTCPSHRLLTAPTERLTSDTRITSDASGRHQGIPRSGNFFLRIGPSPSALISAVSSPTYPPSQSWSTQATTVTKSVTGWTTETKA